MTIALVSVKEQYDERTRSYAEDGTFTATRTWGIELDVSAATSGELLTIDAAAQAACPVVRYDSYPGFIAALARSFSVKNAGALHLWKCTATYSTLTREKAKAGEVTSDGLGAASGASPSSDNSKPADSRPLEIKTVKRTVQVVLEYDADTGNQIRNSAGDLFDPPLETERTYMGYQIKWFVSPANLRWLPGGGFLGRADYLDTVNDRTFKIWGRSYLARRLRVSDVQCNMVWDKIDVAGVTTLSLMYELSVELLDKPGGGWVRKVLDAGRRARPLPPLLGIPFKSVACLDNGQPVADPVPLKANGTRADPLVDGLHYIDVAEFPALDIRALFL